MISMDLLLLLLVFLAFFVHPYRFESFNLSEDEDMELERQLQLLNKPVIKTINSYYGDIFDCVDFYKQPAFDHPLLKNFTMEKSTLLRIQRRGKLSSKGTHSLELHGEGCPLGTVPIKRITKEDLIREKRASNTIKSFAGVEPNRHPRRPDQPPEIYKRYAIARTKVSSRRYSAMQAHMSIYNPQCVEEQYSAARMKMSNGLDSIEVGWRVDPDLSGDSLTRFYIRTDAGQTHCYNLRCPGFVVTASRIPIDQVAGKISKLGGPIFEISAGVSRGTDRGWILEVGPYGEDIGFWPPQIFTSGGLTELASSLSWGGEVYSPEGSPKPPMGSGGILKNDTYYSAYFSGLMVHDERGFSTIASDLETFVSNHHFQINDVGDKGVRLGHLVLYGGPGGSTE